MGLIFAKLCFLCMDADRRGRELRAIQHNNAKKRQIRVKPPSQKIFIHMHVFVCACECVRVQLQKVDLLSRFHVWLCVVSSI